MASAELRALPRLEPEVAKIIAFPRAIPEPVAAAAAEVIPAEPRIVEAEAHVEAPLEAAVTHLDVPVEEAAMSEAEIAVEWEPTPEIHTQYWEQLPEPLADPVEDATLTQVLEADPELALPQVSPLADIALDRLLPKPLPARLSISSKTTLPSPSRPSLIVR